MKAPVRFYLRSGHDPNATDARSRTLLLLAAAAGHADICRLLMESGADPSLRDADGIDALSAAIRNGHAETAGVLRAYLARLAPAPVPYADQARTDGDSSRIGNPPENIAPDPDGDDQTLSLDGWEEQLDAPPPADVPALRAVAAELQSGISAHAPVDSDPAWADVAIELPKSATRFDPAHAAWLDGVRSLIHYGLSWGWVTRQQVAEVAEVAGQTGTGDGRDEVEIHLRLVLGEVGVMVDENGDESFMIDQLWRDWQDAPPSENGHRAIINEAVAFLATEAVPFLGTSGRWPGPPAHLLSQDLRTLVWHPLGRPCRADLLARRT